MKASNMNTVMNTVKDDGSLNKCRQQKVRFVDYSDGLSWSEGGFIDDHVRFKPTMVSKPPIANKAIFCANVCHEASVSAVDCKAYQSTSDDNPTMSMASAVLFGGLSCMVAVFQSSWHGG